MPPDTPAFDPRRYCARPWMQLAVMSDGTVVCACTDSEFVSNPLGNLHEQSVREIWNGPAMEHLRRTIADDIDETPVCNGCPHRMVAPAPPPDRFTDVPLPYVLFVESYGGCNLDCPGCPRDHIESSRKTLTLDFDVYRRLIDDLCPGLRYMEFHVAGENYMHPRAHEMVAYARQRDPDCFILTSTNGHFFHTEERCRQLLDSGLDAIIFSVDGATQETYEKYRVNGRLDRVLDGMRRVVRLRAERGAQRPLLIWRYILFEWSDDPAEMALARRLAAEIGVDELAWHSNCSKSMPSSKRYYDGSPHNAELADEHWDTLQARRRLDVGVDFRSYGSRRT